MTEIKNKQTEYIEKVKDGKCPECGRPLYRNKCFKCGIEIDQ